MSASPCRQWSYTVIFWCISYEKCPFTSDTMFKQVKTRPCAFDIHDLIPDMGIAKQCRQWSNPSNNGHHNIYNNIILPLEQPDFNGLCSSSYSQSIKIDISNQWIQSI